MISRSKLVSTFCLVALAAGMNGCGSDSTTPTAGQSGRLVEGPVTGATVFADRVSGGVRFVQDSDEVATKTDSVTGNFTLPSVPGYNYILVSKGGTDKITGQPAIQLLAPAGAANITALTTLVTLDTTGGVKAKLQALMPSGFSYDSDISTTASPAVLLVTKSVETIVQSLTNSVTSAAVTGGKTLTQAQVSYIQSQTMQAIAQEFAKPAVDVTTLSTTASLVTTLGSAVSTATTNIQANNANVVFQAGTADTLAANAVGATQTVFNIGTTAGTTGLAGGETAAFATAGATATKAFTDSVSATTSGLTVTVNTTPLLFAPPPVQVVTPITIPGTTGTTGGSSSGNGATF